MNRLQKKCFIASVTFHVTLILVLLLGSAFFSSPHKQDAPPLLEFFPIKTTDDQIAPMAGPTAQPHSAEAAAPSTPPVIEPTHPAPPDPKPVQPPVVPEVKHAPTPPEIKPEPPHVEVKRTPHALNLVPVSKPTPSPKPDAAKPTKSKPIIDTSQLVHRHVDPNTTPTTANTPDNSAEEVRTKGVINALRGLQNGLAKGSAVQVPTGLVSSESVANYEQSVRSIYEQTWKTWQPEGTIDVNGTTKVSVTIASDGRVISSEIIRTSGNPLVDHAVQRTLNQIKFVPPFPEGFHEKQRTFPISFILIKTSRST